jgi:protein SCO1/2
MRLRNHLLAVLITLLMTSACNSHPTPVASIASADCLPDLQLTDQNAQTVNLASLKGSPVLFDFIYTSCPGPCELMTQRMAKVADDLGASFGSKIRFVSVTIDPEHDGPPRLLSYAKEQSANRSGWLFLTGDPRQITALMSAFKLERVREADGSIEHVLAFFLVRGDGGLQSEYSPNHTRPEQIAEDIVRFINHGSTKSFSAHV